MINKLFLIYTREWERRGHLGLDQVKKSLIYNIVAEKHGSCTSGKGSHFWMWIFFQRMICSSWSTVVKCIFHFVTGVSKFLRYFTVAGTVNLHWVITWRTSLKRVLSSGEMFLPYWLSTISHHRLSLFPADIPKVDKKIVILDTKLITRYIPSLEWILWFVKHKKQKTNCFICNRLLKLFY